MWGWMHFHKKKKTLKLYFVVFSFYKLIGWKKKG